jgi:hypothetical protein
MGMKIGSYFPQLIMRQRQKCVLVDQWKGYVYKLGREYEFSDFTIFPMMTVCRVAKPVFKNCKYDT